MARTNLARIAAALCAGAIALTFGGPVTAQGQAVSAQAMQQTPIRELIHVSGAVWRFRSSSHYGMVLVTPAGAVVVDPLNAETARWLKGELALRFNRLKVAKVVYSHHHWDHASGAAEFGPVPVVSRTETLRELEPPSEPAARERIGRQFGAVAKPTETYTPPVKRITLGGKRLELHAVRSRHASDLSFVWFPDEKVLMTVDVISPHRLPYRTLDDYDPDDVKHVLDRALAFNARLVAGGHGEVTSPQAIEDLRGYYADLHKAVSDALARGQSLEAMQRDLTLDRYRGWMDYDTFRPMNIAGMHRYLTKGPR